MYCVSGKILTSDGFVKGYICTKKGIIVETGKGKPPVKPVAKGYIIPSPFNAHTHIGDAFIRKEIKELPRDIEKLVAPPNGLKHEMLKQTPDDVVLRGMRKVLHEMVEVGISMFCDFREGGIKGINLLREAMKGVETLNSIVLGRPLHLSSDEDEVEKILEKADGIGVSSISDWNYDDLKKIAVMTRQRGKVFALHVSERIRENIDMVLDLKPDFLVHMVYATESDLERVKDENIPVVVCPRSNVFFGLKPNLKLMKKVRVTVLLGTDNAMISTPNVLEEIKWIKKHFKGFTIQELLNTVTFLPRKTFKLQENSFEEGSKAEFVVLDTKSLKPLFVSLAKRS